MLVVDTDHFSIVTNGRDGRHSALVRRLEDAAEPVLLPIIAVEEQLRAWLAQLRRVSDVHHQTNPYDHLIHLLEVVGEWDIARWTEAAADEFTRLRRARIRIGTQDLKIAAIVLANDATLLSANLRDFNQVPGLRVEDWLHG